MSKAPNPSIGNPNVANVKGIIKANIAGINPAIGAQKATIDGKKMRKNIKKIIFCLLGFKNSLNLIKENIITKNAIIWIIQKLKIKNSNSPSIYAMVKE